MEGPTIQTLQFSASQFQHSALYRPQYLAPPECVDPSPGLNNERKQLWKWASFQGWEKNFLAYEGSAAVTDWPVEGGAGGSVMATAEGAREGGGE